MGGINPKLLRQDAHAHQIGATNALEAPGQPEFLHCTEGINGYGGSASDVARGQVIGGVVKGEPRRTPKISAALDGADLPPTPMPARGVGTRQALPTLA